MIPLFTPLTIKQLTLNNRIVLPPMALDIATEKGKVTRRLIEHYCRRTRGVGLIIVEHAYASREGKAHPNQLGIYDDDLIPGLSQLAAAIHQKGVPVGIQISHAGARAIHSPCAPSNIQSRYLERYGHSQGGRRRMTCAKKIKQEEIPKMVHAFARAAWRGKKAGFDFIEIHGAHGYLLNQFYSPLTNIRHDDYGGSLERRLRFPIEVVKAVREAVGEEMPIFYRLGADDRLPYGTTLDDSVKAAVMLSEAGVDCLDLSGGICGYLKEGEEGFFSYLGKAIKPVVDIPVMVTGGIKTVEKANEIVAQGVADLVGVGRTMLKDPDWARLSIGTLGGGNHFIEVNRDEEGALYLVIHSGSRHLGKQVAEYYQKLAYQELKAASVEISKSLAYLEGPSYQNYLHDMKFVQQYAVLNRQAIVDEIISGLGLTIEERFTTVHNYIDLDTMILRKGAISARKGEKVLIPLNMRDGSLICVGKGNADWNYSAPHGAGRIMSRRKAKEIISLEEFRQSMEGIYTTTVNKSTLDECALAYKDMDEIIGNIGDTVAIVKHIKPVYNFKASE